MSACNVRLFASRLAVVTLALTAALLLPAIARAQTGTVTATVLDRNRQPVAGAEVHLFSLATQEVIAQTQNSDINGSATITGVPVGLYHISAYKDAPYNVWFFSPNFQGWQVNANQITGPIEIVFEDATNDPNVINHTGVQGFVRYDDENGAHPIGAGVHIEFYNGGHYIGFADSDANGHYAYTGLRTPPAFWGFFTYIARWSGVKKVGFNFGAWPGVPIRMDIALPSPVSLASVSLDNFSVKSGSSVTGTVTLNDAAPPGGVYVHLQSDTPSIVSVPTTVFVAGGANSAPFTATTTATGDGAIVNLTGSYNQGSQTVPLEVFPPIVLIAAATGDSKITLYWNGTFGVIGYNVYRSTSSTGPWTKINATPVTSQDPGPGMTNRFVYGDTSGLTNGTLYYYYVASVNPDQTEGVHSSVNGDIPDPNAIPWDTQDAGLITAQALNFINANPFFDDDPFFSDIVIGGPNGVIYQSFSDGSQPTALPPQGRVDKTSNTFEATSGESVGVHSAKHPTGTGDGYDPAYGELGIYRKVESVSGKNGLVSNVTLPYQWFLNPGEAAFIHTGGHLNIANTWQAAEVDAGLMLQPCKTGWQAFVRGGTDIHSSGTPMERWSGSPDLVQPNQVIRLGFASHLYGSYHGKTLYMTIIGDIVRASNGQHYPGLVVTHFMPEWTPAPDIDIMLKRVNSIAQTARSATHPNAPAWRPAGYVASGAYITGATWGFPAFDPFSSYDGYVDIIPSLSHWDTAVTLRQGSMPRQPKPTVKFVVQNPYFWETGINLDTNK